MIWVPQVDHLLLISISPLTDELLIFSLLLTSNFFLQLAKTNEHLKQIFNVPETVEKTRVLILEGHYLQAHKKYLVFFLLLFSFCFILRDFTLLVI